MCFIALLMVQQSVATMFCYKILTTDVVRLKVSDSTLHFHDESNAREMGFLDIMFLFVTCSQYPTKFF